MLGAGERHVVVARRAQRPPFRRRLPASATTWSSAARSTSLPAPTGSGSRRTFADPAYQVAHGAPSSHTPASASSLGVVRNFGPAFSVARDRALRRQGQRRPRLHARGTRWTCRTPSDFGHPLAGQRPSSSLRARSIVRTWSGANSDLLAQGGTGAEQHGRGLARRRVHAGPAPADAASAPVRRPLRHAALRLVPGRAAARVRRVARHRDPLRPAAGRDRSRRGACLALGRELHRAGVPVRTSAVTVRAVAGYLCGAMKRVYIETYGCQMNVADSELMFGVLGREGYVRADNPADADVMLVNTCAVRDNAEQRVIGRMGELQRHKRPGDVLGVVGCMAQRLGPALLERVPRVDLVVGPDAYRNLPELIGLAGQGQRSSTDAEFRAWEHYEDVPAGAGKGSRRRSSRYSAAATTAAPSASSPTPVARSAAGGWPTSCAEVEQLVAHGHHARSRCSARPSTAITTAEHDFADLLRAVGAVGWDPPGAVHQPVPHRLHAARHRGDGRPRPPSASTCTCRSRAARTPCSGACCAATPARATSRSWRSSGRPSPASPSRPTSSSVSRARPRRSSRRRSASSPMRSSTTPTRSSTRSARRHAGRPAQGSRARRGRLRAARPPHRSGPCEGPPQERRPAWAQTHEVLVERPARRGELMLGRTRTNQLVLLELPASAVGEYHRCRLTGTTGSTFTGAVVTPALAVL